MSNDNGVYERLNALEVLNAETRSQLAHLERAVGTISEGMQTLLAESRQKPDSLTWKAVVATLITAGTVAGMLWIATSFVVAASPAVTDVTMRMRDLDMPERGRLAVIERRIAELEAAAVAPRVPPAIRQVRRRPAQ